jgi:hypothetical protein
MARTAKAGPLWDGPRAIPKTGIVQRIERQPLFLENALGFSKMPSAPLLNAPRH